MKKLLILIFLVFSDFITKYFVKNNLLLNQSLEINSFFKIAYIQNYGVSFGLFSGTVPYWLLIIIALIIIIIIFYLMKVSTKTLEINSYFIIIIGAVANVLDRVINTFVVDFLLVHYQNYYWPAFNLADIYITIGIIMLLISFFIKNEDK